MPVQGCASGTLYANDLENDDRRRSGDLGVAISSPSGRDDLVIVGVTSGDTARWARDGLVEGSRRARNRRRREQTGGYRLGPDRAEELVDVLVEERAYSIANIRAEIAAGNASWIRNWAGAGGDERAAADDAWIAAHRSALVLAAGG